MAQASEQQRLSLDEVAKLKVSSHWSHPRDLLLRRVLAAVFQGESGQCKLAVAVQEAHFVLISLPVSPAAAAVVLDAPAQVAGQQGVNVRS